MRQVEMGKVWKVETIEDLQMVYDVLKENEFCAKMSDDYTRECEELSEIRKQWYNAALQARDKGLI